MNRLVWKPMRAPMPEMQMWGARDGFVSYVVTRDVGCLPDDKFYGRYAASVRVLGSSATDHLGVFDTLEQAKGAADEARRPDRPQS